MSTSTTIADVANKINSVNNRGAWTSTPTSSGKVTIPAGYHNGSGYVDTSKVYTAGQSTIVTQTKSGGKGVSKGSSSSLILTFEQLSKISGVSSISISGVGERLVTTSISISGNTITFKLYNSSSSTTYTANISVTAFEIKS